MVIDAGVYIPSFWRRAAVKSKDDVNGIRLFTSAT